LRFYPILGTENKGVTRPKKGGSDLLKLTILVLLVFLVKIRQKRLVLASNLNFEGGSGLLLFLASQNLSFFPGLSWQVNFNIGSHAGVGFFTTLLYSWLWLAASIIP